jgi:hypothetical protein
MENSMGEVNTKYTTKSGDEVKIEYVEHGNQWRAEMQDEFVTAPSLRELKEKLDKKTSPKAKARRIPCLVREGYQATLAPAHATSTDDHNQYVRVTYEKTKHGRALREQVSRSKVFANSEHNRALAVEIGAAVKELNDMSKRISALGEKLVPFDLAQLKDE